MPYAQRFHNQNIVYPAKSNNPHEKVDYRYKNPQTMRNMYAESNVAELPIFGRNQGLDKFINFGFWEKTTSFKGLTEDEQYDIREEASKRLYDEVIKKASIKKDSIVVDLGCGPGSGTLYIHQKYSPASVIGVDPVPEQIGRAKQMLEENNIYDKSAIQFLEGNAEKLPLPDNSITHLVCVEAVQHFPSIENFIKEAKRVLKPNGKLVFASFFAKDKEGLSIVQEYIPDHEIHCSTYTIEDLFFILNSMKDVSITSIGSRVFPVFKAWLINVSYSDQWTMYWPLFYEANRIDYVICEAKNLPCQLLNDIDLEKAKYNSLGEENNGETKNTTNAI